MRRTHRWWLGAGALALVALLTFWAEESARRSRCAVDVREEPAVAEAPPPTPLLMAAPEPDARALSAVAGGSPTDRPFHMHVRWLDSKEAVEGALVALLSRPVDVERDLAIPTAMVLASGATDASGGVALSSSSVPVAVWARASSSLPATTTAPPDGAPMVVELARAPVIGGSVRTEAGDPVADVALIAWPRHLPKGVAEDVRSWEGQAKAILAVSTGKTDSTGHFVLPAWSREPHTVRLGGDWGIAGVPRDATGADRLVAVPGGQPVEFVVEVIALAQVRFIDSETKEPVDVPPGLVDVSFDRTVARVWSTGGQRWRWSGSAGTVEGPADDVDPSVTRWQLRVQPRIERPSEIAMQFNTAGFAPGRAVVPLVGSEEGARGKGVAEIEVRRVGRAATGRALLECRGVTGPPGLVIGPGALLLLKGPAGGGATAIGRRAGEGLWEFRGLPEGQFQGTLSVGWWAESDPFEVTLKGGARAQVDVRFDTRAWVELVLLDPSARRVSDAAIVNVYRNEGGRLTQLPGPSGGVTEAGIAPTTGAMSFGAFNVAPGSYVVTCAAAGFGRARAEFEAVAGETTRVTLQFPPAVDAGR